MKTKISLDSVFSAFYLAEISGQKKSYRGKEKDNLMIPLKVICSKGNHPAIEGHRLIQGKNKGSIKLRLKSFDYTKESVERKVTWKIEGRSWKNPFIDPEKNTAHISKIYPLSKTRAWIDFGKDCTDIAFLVFDKELSFEKLGQVKIFVALNKKNDSTFRQLFKYGSFDELLGLELTE